MTVHDRTLGLRQRVRRWLGEGESAGQDDAPRLSWQEQAFRDVGAFLFEHGLYPSPDNYDLAWQFRTAVNARLVAAIRAEIDTKGVLSADAADRIFAESASPITPDSLARMAEDIEGQMAGLSGIAKQSGADAAAFRHALEASPGDVTSVLDLTRAMIARTRNAEAQLRRSTKELEGLRAHLAEAQQFADLDPLTELANRRCFKRKLEAAIVDARAKGKPLALAFIDIDHFKLLNDRHGHETGDRVLRHVAQGLSRHFGKRGLVGRFGGEEFIVMLPNLDEAAAFALVDRHRAALAETPLYSATTRKPLGLVSFTAGLTMLLDDDDMASLLRRADDTLYRGKAEGRNRVVAG